MQKIKLLLFISLFSCGQAKETKQENSETNKNSIQTQSIDGTYEYIYPDNTSDLTENQYIILKNNTGLFYGTSDEFDEAREGYLPGFFVTDMQDLKISKDKIKFKLKITSTDLFEKAVSLKLKSSADTKKAGYKPWEAKIPLAEKQYEGIIKGDTLYFKAEIADFDKRFIKRQ